MGLHANQGGDGAGGAPDVPHGRAGGASVRAVTGSGRFALPRRPLVGLGLLFLAGVGTGWMSGLSAVGPAVAAGVCLIAAFSGAGRMAVAGLCLASFFTGWTHSASVPDRVSERSLDRSAVRAEEFVRLVGRITDDPILRRSSIGRASWRFTIRTEAEQRTEWMSARGDLQVLLAESALPNPRYGDRVLVSGRWRKTDTPAAISQVWAHTDSWRVLDRGHGNPLMSAIYAARRRAARVLSLGLENAPDAAAVQTALLLGLREDVPDELMRAYRGSGTFHVFAISGLHVGILCVIWIGLLQLAGMPRTRWAWALTPLLAGYVAATGAAPSAVRAALMTIIFFSASVFRRRPDAPTSLTLAAVFCVAVDPRQLFQPGFIYSFAVTTALLSLLPVFARTFDKGTPQDAYRIEMPSAAMKARRILVTWGRGLVWISVAAWLASTPLSAWYSNRVSPSALIGNLFMAPASFVIVFTGCLSLAAGTVSSLLAEVFNHANRIWITGVNAAVMSLMHIPGACFNVARPSVAAIVSWYAGWGALFFLRGASRRWLAGGAAAVLLGLGIRAVTDSGLRAETLDADPAVTTLLRRPFRMTVVADPGPAFRAEAAVRNLRAAGVNRIDVLVLRVPLTDWSGAAGILAQEFPVGEIWAPETGARFPAFRKLLDGLEQEGCTVRRWTAGVHVEVRGVEADVFFPAPGQTSRRALDAALGVRFAYEDQAILLFGPLAADALRVPFGADLAATEWMTVLPAGTSADWTRLLDAFPPRTVRFLVPPYKAIGSEWTNLLEARGIEWRRAGESELSESPETVLSPALQTPADPAGDRIPSG